MDFSPWHLICTGQDASNAISSCELFNWKTGEQCQLPDFPQPSHAATGIIFDGIPCICGGFNGVGFSKLCFKFDKLTRTWIRVSITHNFLDEKVITLLHPRFLCFQIFCFYFQLICFPSDMCMQMLYFNNFL